MATNRRQFGLTFLEGLQGGCCTTTVVENQALTRVQNQLQHTQSEVTQLKQGMLKMAQSCYSTFENVERSQRGQLAYNKKMASNFTSLKEDVENNKTQTKALAKATAEKMGQLKEEIVALKNSRERQTAINHGLQKQISELRAENETLKRQQGNLEARQTKLEDDFEDLLNQINNI